MSSGGSTSRMTTCYRALCGEKHIGQRRDGAAYGEDPEDGGDIYLRLRAVLAHVGIGYNAFNTRVMSAYVRHGLRSFTGEPP